MLFGILDPGAYRPDVTLVKELRMRQVDRDGGGVGIAGRPLRRPEGWGGRAASGTGETEAELWLEAEEAHSAAWKRLETSAAVSSAVERRSPPVPGCGHHLLDRAAGRVENQPGTVDAHTDVAEAHRDSLEDQREGVGDG